MGNSNDRLKLVKRNSQAQVLLAVQKHGPISRANLAKITGQSLTGASRIVDELISEGVLIEGGTSAGPRGRPMGLVSINSDGAPAAGVWLGPDTIEITIASPNGEVLARRSVSYDCGDGLPLSIIVAITQGIQKCAEVAGKNHKYLRGVGVAVAGSVDTENGFIVEFPDKPGWNNVPITRLIQARLGIPVYASNDVQSGALAAEWFGGHSNGNGALYVVISNAIMAAFVNDYQIMQGAHDAASQIGHLSIERNGQFCECGNRGCLNSLGSDKAFIRRIWPTAHHRPAAIGLTDDMQNQFAERPSKGIIVSDGEGVYLQDMGPFKGVSVGGGVLPSDMDVSVDVSMGGESIWCAGVAYRQTKPDTRVANGYHAYFKSNGSAAIIQYCTANEHREIAHVSIDPAIDFSSMHTMRVRVDGNRHEMWLDDDKYIDVTDDTEPGGGYVALTQVTAHAVFDNWAYFDNLRIELLDSSHGGTLVGRVFDSGNGKAIAGAKVQLVNGLSMMTAEDGTYEFSGLNPGSLKVTIFECAYNKSVKYIDIKADSITTLNVELSDASVDNQQEEVYSKLVSNRLTSGEMAYAGAEMAKQGQTRAKLALEHVAQYLGIGIGYAVTILDPQVVVVCGRMVDAAPDLMLDMIRREAMQYVNVKSKGVEIRSSVNIEEFHLLGSVGLVFSRPFQVLREDNKKSRSIVNVDTLVWTPDIADPVDLADLWQ